MQVRTRFAPSPTGYLHVGSARTALFCWLYAKKTKGKFILRIEDTDRERSTEQSVNAIFEAMKWLALDYDEGPFFQTQRLERYYEVANRLLSEGKAYRCYCSKERLDVLREAQQKNHLKPRYDGHCRDLNLPQRSEPFVIRFRNPLEGEVVLEDQVYGKIVFQNQELDDLVIVRSDGMPTYNFSVAIDDWDMLITHIIRGDDHINNTPRQINILQALGAELPVYAHVPMILGEDGKRLSKRHGAVSVTEYRDQGYLSDALLNYLVRLGWSHGDQEIFTKDEMIQFFDITAINRAPGALNHQKLTWLNQHYLKTIPLSHLTDHFVWQIQHNQIEVEGDPDFSAIVQAQRERVKTLEEMVDKSRFLLTTTIEYDEQCAQQHLTPGILPMLKDTRERFNVLNESDWKAPTLHQIIHDITVAHAIKLGQLAQPLRVALTGGLISPPIDTTLYLLGKSKTLMRLDDAIAYIER